jgi:hypothetical protein
MKKYSRNATFLPKQTITASGNTVSYEISDYDKFVATLDVTAVSGTSPTLDVIIEESADGNLWTTLASFTQKTVVGTEVIRVTNPFHNKLRVKHTVGGTTPSFTAEMKVTLR